MRTAVLILAHDQPDHLARLVQALKADRIDIFIHIDASVDIATFKQSLSPRHNLHFLTDAQRVHVEWAGFSMVQATLHLLYVSYLDHIPFDRFCLLSGSDFPVKPLNSIMHIFETDKEFLNVSRCLDGTEDTSHQDNVSYAYDEITGARTPRDIEHHLPFYQGSQWWALTRPCIEWILDFLRDYQDYTAFHKLTRCPDEIFFQSIVMNSRFRTRITQDMPSNTQATRHPCLYGCHYIDWHPKEGGNIPKVLDESDEGEIIKSGALFARKIRTNASGKLIQLLMAKTKKNEPIQQ